MGFLKTGLKFLLAFVFLMSGANKITDAVHKETHNMLRADFKNTYGAIWQKALDKSGLPSELNIALDDGSKTYANFCLYIGAMLYILQGFERRIVEVASVVMLFSPVAVIGNFLLICAMAGGVYTHIAAADGKEIVPGVLLALLIILILPSSPAAKSGKTKTR